MILDGKIVDSDRCHEKTLSRKGREIDLWYSGKKKDFGGNIQALFYPDGTPMWVSDVLPGNVNDLAAARESVLAELRLFVEELGPGRRRLRRRRSRRHHPGEEARGNERTRH